MSDTSEQRLRIESTASSASRTVNHDLVAFDDVIAKDDMRRSMTIQKSRETKATGRPNNKSSTSDFRKGAPGGDKTLYERIVGKTPNSSTAIKSPPPGAPLRNSIVGWFTKETAEERAIRSMLKTYRTRLQQELQYANRALTRYQKKLADQVSEYEKQERQLISWGLKAALPKFHTQAWYRIERCRLFQKLTEETVSVLENRQKKAQIFLQNFEESANRSNKYSAKSTEEFCLAPDKLILLDSTVLSLQDRLKRIDLLYAVASKQFMLLEPEFEWKDQKDRRREFFRILQSYNQLPSFEELDNIETDLSWTSFCNWVADRMTKQKKIEQEFFDFIEDSREVEGRLFQRWQTCVLLSLSTVYGLGGGGATGAAETDESAGAGVPGTGTTATGRETSRGSMEGGDMRQSNRPMPLKVTPASIRAFVQYFATDIIGVKYNIPKEYLAANKLLTEALFYRRIAPYVFRYQDQQERRQDEFWRIQCQRCRYLDPRVYHVMDRFLKNQDEAFVPALLPSPKGQGGQGLHSPALRRETTDSLATAHSRADSSGQHVTRTNRSASWTSPPTSSSLLPRSQSGLQFVTPGAAASNVVQSLSPAASSSSLATAGASTGAVGGKDAMQTPPPTQAQSHNTHRLSASLSSSVCHCYYCQTLSLSQRLQRLPVFDDRSVMLGQEFGRSARVLSWMSLAMTPREITSYLTVACKWILRDAIDVSGSRAIIGADEMVPLFTMVLIHAQIPNIHMLLRILTDFGEYDEQGDISYNVANLEGSMRLIMDLTSDIPAEIVERFQQSDLYASIVSSTLQVRGSVVTSQSQTALSSLGTKSASGDGPSSPAVAATSANTTAATTAETTNNNGKRQSGTFSAISSPAPPPPPPSQSSSRSARARSHDMAREDLEAMEQLGEWLRDQKTMEDTIAILQSDGWML